MQKIKENNIFLIRGDSLVAQIGVLQNGATYTPTVDDEIVFTLIHNTLTADQTDYEDEEPILTKQISTETMILEIEPDDTRELEFGKYDYGIKIIMANGFTDTFISGQLTLMKGGDKWHEEVQTED